MSILSRTLLFYMVLCFLTGCPGERINVKFTHQGLIECFRLDREPINSEHCGDDLGNGNLARPETGNYHQNLDEEMTTNILLENMSKNRLEKLPISDCLWTAGSQFGSGDRISLFWDAYFSTEVTKGDLNIDENGLHSACRFDPPFNRISISDNLGESGINDMCLSTLRKKGGFGGDVDLDSLDFNNFKSTCDLHFYGFGLYEHTMPVDDFGRCQNYSSEEIIQSEGERVTKDRHLKGIWEDDLLASACGPSSKSELTTMMPARDVVLSVSRVGEVFADEQGNIKKDFLQPQIKTVIDKRSIARSMQQTQGNLFNWQAVVLVQGLPGQQKWQENFSENIRVDQVKFFRLINGTQNNREYLNLQGATLRLYDPDDEIAGFSELCNSEDGTVIDVVACQIDATPTYRPENLNNNNLTSLSNPLIWEVELANEQSGDLYIEFDLVSVYESREAAILAETPYVDFGGILPTLSKQQLITVTNVGYGPYMIDAVGIDPNYGQAHAFHVERLDDPVMFPYFVYLEPTGEDHEYRIDFQDLSHLSSQLDLREFETHTTATVRYNNNVEIEVESEAVMLQGHVAVAQSPNPSFDGSLRHEDRIYPFRYPVYQTWQLPYLLQPGEQRTVMVSSEPSHIGEFEGKMDISGYPVHAPNNHDTISVFMESYGMTGALIEVIPKSLTFPYRGHHNLNVILVNPGDVGFMRGDLSIIDIDSQIHTGEAVNFNLDANTPTSNSVFSGDSELIKINYSPGCFSVVPAGKYHRASLKIETDIGSFLVPLAGNPERSAENNPACAPGG